MQVNDVIFDPKLGYTAFTVERLTYNRSAEKTTSRSRTFQALGCVHPDTPEMILLLEEEQNETFIEIYTDFILSLGIDETCDYVSY